MIKIKKVEHNEIVDWQIATKTRPIKAKALINLLVDRTVVNKFLIDTLEGREPLGDGSIICVGEAGDTWQQMQNKLLAKYSVEEIDDDGWMICHPRPDNAVDCSEVSEVQCEEGKFYIIGQWGETYGDQENVQKGVTGDFICRNRIENDDVWIVNRKLFLNTYTIKS